MLLVLLKVLNNADLFCALVQCDSVQIPPPNTGIYAAIKRPFYFKTNISIFLKTFLFTYTNVY